MSASVPPPRLPLAAMLQHVGAARGRAAVLSAVEEVVCQLVGCEEFALLELEPASGALTVAHQVGLKLPPGAPWPAARGLVQQAARSGVPYVAGRSFAGQASPEELHLSGCVPVRAGSRIRGVLALFRLLPHKRALTQMDADLLTLLAQEAGGALWGAEATTPVPGSLRVVDGAGLREAAAVAGAGRTSLTPQPGPTRSTFIGTARTLVPAAETPPSLVYLHPGQLHAAASEAEVSTILGSCVAVCLWDARLRLGGVNHFLLPTSAGGPDAAPHRYGDTAIPALFDALQGLGSRRAQLRAKVYGGAAIGGEPSAAAATQGVGARNVQLAHRLLAMAGIPVVEEDVGGARSRKLRFRLCDGSASVKLLGGAA